MPSSGAPVKRPAFANDEENRFETSGETQATESRPVLDEVDARQAVTGHSVRYVLFFGLAAVIIAFAAILYFDFYR